MSHPRPPHQAPSGTSGDELPVLDPVRLLRLGAEAAAPVGLVVLVVALEPHRTAVALEGEDVGRNAVEEPAIVADDHRAAPEVDERVLYGAERVDVEVVGRLVEEEHVATGAEQLGEVDAVSLAAGQVLHLLLLVGAGEVEERGVRARVHLALADEDRLPPAVGQLLPHRALAVEGLAALVDVGDDDRVAETERAAVGLLVADDHTEERRLAGAVRADHADDAAPRQVEVDAVHEQPVAVPLAEPARLDHEVAEPRTRRDRDARGTAARFGRLVLREELLVGGEPRLALRLARARRHPHPLELACKRPAARRGFLLLLREPPLLLLEPRGVVPLPRDAEAAVELQDPAGDVVEEVAVVGDGDDGAWIFLEMALEPRDGFRVEVVGGLVEEEQVGLAEEDLAERDAPALASRERGHFGLARRK